jgi:pimeloyl-ACP methyl ester carboxylesterase
LQRTLPTIALFLLLLAGCGGGGGGGSTGGAVNDPATPVPGETTPEVLELIDSLPSNGSSPAFVTGVSISHAGQSDATYSVDLSCNDRLVVTERRSVADLSIDTVDQIASHKITCPEGLTDNASLQVVVTARRENDATSEAALNVDVTSDEPRLSVIEEKRNPRHIVEDMFESYIEGALIGELDLPTLVENVLLILIVDLAGSEWRHLANPEVVHDVMVRKLEYSSIAPDGSVDHGLSGLVAYPVIDNNFETRQQIILLNHATGSTPSGLNEADAWYILANLLAGHGYLVIAPDNYGRGSTEAEPETYLMANRTARNAVDLVRRIVDSGDYTDVHAATTPLPISVIGYSQGGHSAIASWVEISESHSAVLKPNTVHVGGAPLHLYRTFRGVLQTVAGQCTGDGYCSLVDVDVQVPFATDRILPGLLAYTDPGLAVEELVVDGNLDPAFSSGFLAENAVYDALKSLLLLNSFPNIVNPQEVFNDSDVTLHLYHSQFDRLVPVNNTIEFYDTVQQSVNTILHENQCNADGFELIFDTVDSVGVVHTLCGLNVLDDVFDQLR